MMRLREDLGPLRRRAAVMFAVIVAALGLLLLRVAHLQLVHGHHWRQLAANNRQRSVPVPASRGRIYDRHGHVLADTVASFQLLLYPNEARDLNRTLLFLARLGIAPLGELREITRRPTPHPAAPVVIADGLEWPQVAAVRAHQSDHPELSVVSGFRRDYPNGALTAHVLGTLRLPSQVELDADPDLAPDALVGASGVEALRQEVLAGADGERRLVVSAVGRQLGLLEDRPAVPGTDVTLTLDLQLQQTAAAALGEHAGAVVALDPQTGAVRVLYSAPSFDPNVFTGRLSSELWRQLRDDPAHPLQDRALQGQYPPGSTIKPFFALAGLDSDLIDLDWSVYCRGLVVLHGHPFRCWVRGGHGRVAVERSLEVSCDSFYYLLGQRLGIDGMTRWLRGFGFGEATGIGLAGEASGLLGTPEWSRRVRGQPWYPGTTVSFSIGQGPFLVTPLQLARGFAVLANGGRVVRPFLVEGDADLRDTPRLALEASALAAVQGGLERVVHGSEGTARSLAALPVAGKTGTAQVAALQGVPVEQLELRLRHHALFAAWGPLDDPRLAVAVVVEHGGSGGGVAAPVAREVLRAALLPPAPPAG